MLQVKDTMADKVAHFNSLVELCYTYEVFKREWDSESKSPNELELEISGGKIIRSLVEEVKANNMDISERFIVTQVAEDRDPDTIELDESYLLLRLSEEDVTQVLYFYGFHDLEVSIEGDPTVIFVDGHELSNLMGGCHVEMRGWLYYTEGYHKKQEEIMRATISQSIQDIAHAKKGRVNHFAFL